MDDGVSVGMGARAGTSERERLQTSKNNIVLRFLMKLVRDSVVLSAEADFLRVGHTHEDIDQFIGQLCSWLHHQPVAQTPQDFVRHIQGFLNTLTKKPWPQDARDRRCVYINQGRDWKTWLESMPGLIVFFFSLLSLGVCHSLGLMLS